jgi:type IV pilus assembly protein PilE
VNKNRGFTLIELMVVVIIIAVLAALALPSYLAQTRKSRREAAESKLNEIALLEERYRADNASYLSATTAATWAKLGMSDPTGTYYKYTVTAFAAAGTAPAYFELTATALSSQVSDKAQGTSCTPLTYKQVYDTTNKILNIVLGPAAVCWNK